MKNCITRKCNCVLFAPDNKEYTIDQQSPIGWYILYAPNSIDANLYLRKSNLDLIGYSTKYSKKEDCVSHNQLTTTGLCNLIYCAVEDSTNQKVYNEKHDGNQKNQLEYTGFIKSKKQINYESRTYFGLMVNSGYIDQPLEKFPSFCSIINIELKFIGSDILIPEKIFGIPITISGTTIQKINDNFINTVNSTDVYLNILYNSNNKIIRIDIASNTNTPFSTKIKNTKIKNTDNSNIYFKIHNNSGNISIFLDEISVESTTGQPIELTIDNPDNLFFNPILVFN